MSGAVSVIVPVYRSEAYLRQALDSIAAQTYKDLQIILVDDGSPDASGAICDAYAQKDSRFSVIHKENGGVSSARNAGIDLAQGKWLYFMDSDDWIEPDTLELAVAKAEESGADMVFFGLENVEGDQHYRMPVLRCIDNTKEHFFSDLSDIGTFKVFYTGGIYTSIVRRDKLGNTIRFEEQMKGCEDSLFRAECYRRIGSFAYIPKICYHYRQVPGSAANGGVSLEKYRIDASYRREKTLGFSDLFEDKDALLRIANSDYLTCLSTRFVNILSDKAIPYQEKTRLIRETVRSPEYQQCLCGFDRSLLSNSAKMSIVFGRVNVGTVVLAYYGKKVHNALLGRQKDH